MAQVTFTGMTQADAEKYLTARPGRAASIQVRAGPGVGQQELVDRLTPVLPDGVEAITGQESAEENTEMISSQFLTVFTLFLLVFSGVAILVATFSIHNTFAIVVAQRTRENALLRALGASRRQVTAATLVEATAVAVTASIAGLAGGIGIAAGLQALFPAIGFPFPEGDLVISPLSMLLPLAVGVVVCLGSALLPAVRAGRTAPLAALRETAVDRSGTSSVRAVVGAGLGALALAMTLTGVLVSPSLWLAGLGAVLALAAFVVLGPVASTTVVRILGGPLDRLRGVTGGLARRNALRSPKRTAATASALMIGVAVVSLFTVFGASLKATMDQTVSRSFAGDVAVSTPSFGAGGSGLSPGLAPAIAQRPEVADAVGLGRGVAEVDGRGRALTVTDPVTLGRVFDLGDIRGSLDDLGTDGIAVTEAEADKQGLKTGDTARTRLHRRPEAELHGPRRLRPVGTRRRLRDHPRRLGPAPHPGLRHLDRRLLQGRRERGRGQGRRAAGRRTVRRPRGADPRRVRRVVGRWHRHDAHPRLRAAGPRGAHRTPRHRQHADPRDP